jgi:NADH-quinone oxidoreductase subunit H
MMDAIKPLQDMLGPLWPLVWTLLKIVAILLPVVLGAAYLTYAERKILAAMQFRIGINRVGPWGLFQPLADAVKAIFKEIIIPARADKALFIFGPILAFASALSAWAVVPFSQGLVLANIDAGVLYLLAISSVGVYGAIIAGWATNSKYAFLGAMRVTAQMVSYEIAMGFALICVLMVSSSLNLTEIVHAQSKGQYFAGTWFQFLSWNWLPMFPMFMVYMISGVAETNRAPFDVVEGESEIVAGHMIEYSGIAFALFFLAEYANMILVSIMTSIFFLGGWISPVSFLPDSFVWLALKTAVLLFAYLWIRATFPRYRYDQIMRLGWKVFVPLCMLWVLVIGVWMMSPFNIWK